MNVNLTFFAQLINALVSIVIIRKYLVRPFLIRLERKMAVLKNFSDQASEADARAKKFNILAISELQDFRESIAKKEQLGQHVAANFSDVLSSKSSLHPGFKAVDQANIKVFSQQVLELIHDIY